jgi:DNA invertase Pin-like site-specific DNA recombinase
MQKQRSQQAIIYAAKSTEDKRGSIPTQLADGRALAEKEGLPVAAEYADEAASAWSGDRGPELAAALDHAERIGAALIVQHSDRLARGDARQARHLIEVYLWSLKAGVALRSVQDDSTFENLVMAVVMGERNTEDSRRKSEAVRAGLARRRKQGKFVGSRCFGLTWQRNEKDEREVVHEPSEAPVVERIAAELLAGVAQIEIARRLNAERIPTARGGRWHQGTVRSILANPAIAGLIRDGDELIEAQHAAIIPRETWDQIQALREARAKTHRRGRPSSGKHLFRKGFLRCGECGEAMVPRTARNRSGTLYEGYLCLGRRQDPTSCTMPPILRADVDTAVYRYFEQVGLDVEATREQLTAAVERKRAEVQALCDAAEREAQQAAERLARVKRDYTHGELTAAEWRELRADLAPELDAAQAEAERLRERLRSTEAETAISDVEAELFEQLTRIRAAVAGEVTDAAGVAAVRSALLRLFDGFTLRRDIPDRAHVELIDTRWIEPLVSEKAVAGYDEKLRPVLARKPLEQAENNYAEAFDL